MVRILCLVSFANHALLFPAIQYYYSALLIRPLHVQACYDVQALLVNRMTYRKQDSQWNLWFRTLLSVG